MFEVECCSGGDTHPGVRDPSVVQHAETIDGELVVTPHPRRLHEAVAEALKSMLAEPFWLDETMPGGWWIHEDAGAVLVPEEQELQPDLVGWRRSRLEESLEEDPMGEEVTPDWVCEALSPASERLTRDRKLPLYARHGVPWVWLVDLQRRTLEIHYLDNGSYLPPQVFSGAPKIRAPPFDAFELDLELLWREAKKRGRSIR